MRRVVLNMWRLIKVAASPQEVFRVLFDSNLGRGFSTYRKSVVRLVLVDLVIAVVIALFVPWLLIPGLIVVVLVGLWLRWQARPTRGSDQDWPPGPIAVGSRSLADPNYFFDLSERHGAVFKANHFSEPMACIVGIHAAAELFRDHSAELAPIPLSWDKFIPQGMARWMDGDIHDEYRSLLKTTFGARLLADNTASLLSEIELALERIARDSGSAGVHPLPYLEEMCYGAWAAMFFGIERGSDRFDELRRLFDVIAVHDPAPMPEVHAALDDIEELVLAVQKNDLHPDRRTVLNGIQQRQSDAAHNPTTMMNLVYLMETSFHDVAGLLTWVLHHASGHPEFVMALRDDNSGQATPQSLGNRMVSETLRLEQSEHLYRRAKVDIRLGEFVIPADWLVRVCVHESHRDPALFPDPNTYDPDRFLESRGSGSFAPFGIDDHACIGETFTRLVARSLLTTFASKYDAEIVSDGPRILSTQRQWAPSTNFRVRLTGVSGVVPDASARNLVAGGSPDVDDLETFP